MSLFHTLAVYGREARTQILSTWRTPQFLIPSLALPLLFYGVIGLGLSHGHEEAAHAMLANYVIFASIRRPCSASARRWRPSARPS